MTEILVNKTIFQGNKYSLLLAQPNNNLSVPLDKQMLIQSLLESNST